jgi:type IV secretory pathway VirB10-like protein
MGRFARSRDLKTTSSRAPSRFAIASLGRASRPETKLSEPVKPSRLTPSYDLDARRAGNEARSNRLMPSKKRSALTGAKLFWIILASLIGVSSGWMLGRTWLRPPQMASLDQVASPETPATNSAAVNPAERKQSPEADAREANAREANARDANAGPAPAPDTLAPSVEQSVSGNQDSDNSERVDRSRSAVRRAHGRGRRAAVAGPGRDMFRPFKVFNPMKLKRLRIW